MKNILTEDTRKNLVAAFQRVADDIRYGIVGFAAGYNEITVRVMLNTLHNQQLLTQYGYDELCKLLETTAAIDTPIDSMTTIINRVEDIVENEWTWQCCAPLYTYPLPFGVAHALRKTLTDILEYNDPCYYERWNELSGFLKIFGIVNWDLMSRLDQLARDAKNREYKGTYTEMRDKVYEITGTDG